MGPPRCTGPGNGLLCKFHPSSKGAKAVAKSEGKCVVCSPTYMQHMCSTGQLRGCLQHHLRRIRSLDAGIGDEAIRQVPTAWRMAIATGCLREGQALTPQMQAIIGAEADETNEPAEGLPELCDSSSDTGAGRQAIKSKRSRLNLVSNILVL